MHNRTKSCRTFSTKLPPVNRTVSADLPTPPAPTTTMRYSVISLFFFWLKIIQTEAKCKQTGTVAEKSNGTDGGAKQKKREYTHWQNGRVLEHTRSAPKGTLPWWRHEPIRTRHRSKLRYPPRFAFQKLNPLLESPILWKLADGEPNQSALASGTTRTRR